MSIVIAHPAFGPWSAFPRSARNSAWRLLLLVLGLFASFAIAHAGLPPARTAAVKPAVLILYDSWRLLPHPAKEDISATDGSLGSALQLEQLLGHFPFSAQLVRLSDYHRGLLVHYSYVFFVGNLKDTMLPGDFLRDVPHYRGSFYWMDYGLGQLNRAFLTRLGLAFLRVETTPGYPQVYYHGVELAKGDPAINIIRVTAPARVVATAADGKRARVPYMVRSGHFWYVADLPFSYAGDRDRYYAFTDTLYDFFGVQPKAQKRAFLRVEDINVTDDQNQLREIADRLHHLQVPFMMAVIPRYQNATSAKMDQVGITMTSVPGYAATLRYMTTHGGTVIMHGWNHRYRGVSAEDFEFWNPDDNARTQTRPDDSTALVEAHLHQGVVDCFAAHLYPIAWETPHYAASMLDYSVIARHFSTAVEQRGLLNDPDYGQFFPYVIRRDIYGQQIFPENLGYIETQMTADNQPDFAKEAQEVDGMLRKARVMSVLRDVTVGAFVHPYVDTRLIVRLARGLKRAGFTFINLRDEHTCVQFDDLLIATGAVQGQLHLHAQYLHEFFLDRAGHVRREHASKGKITGTVKRSLGIPAGWIYVCRGEQNSLSGRNQ